MLFNISGTLMMIMMNLNHEDIINLSAIKDFMQRVNSKRFGYS